MKKKLLGLSVIGLTIFSLASCGSKEASSLAASSAVASSNTTSSATASSNTTSSAASSQNVNVNYHVNVIDIDGEVLLNQDLVSTSKTSVLTDLQNVTTVLGYESTYGYSLSSVAGSIFDPNYYLATYENGEYAQVGIEGLTIDEGDTFTFQVECWNTVASGYGTLTDTDLLIDKTLYSYAKNIMPAKIAKDTTYTTSNYWTYMMISLMKRNGYDKTVFNTNAATDTLKSAISEADVTTITGANFGKYFYINRALGNGVSDAYKTAYTSALEGLTSYSQYATPFIISPAYELELGDKIADAVKNPESPTVSGDAKCWYLASNALWNANLSADNLASLPTTVQSNSISQALILLAYAAYNESGADVAKTLIDTFYDSESGLIKYQTTSTNGTNYMIEQVYAGLAAYKVQRDTGKAANIFA